MKGKMKKRIEKNYMRLSKCKQHQEEEQCSVDKKMSDQISIRHVQDVNDAILEALQRSIFVFTSSSLDLGEPAEK